MNNREGSFVYQIKKKKKLVKLIGNLEPNQL